MKKSMLFIFQCLIVLCFCNRNWASEGSKTVIKDRAAFLSLDQDLRSDIIDGWNLNEYSNVKVLGYTNPLKIESITNPDQKKLAEAMLDFMNEKCYLEIEVNIDNIATVGELEEAFSFAILDDGTLLGGRIFFSQRGVELPNNDGPTHFDSIEEALAAGAFESDVSWAASGMFELNLDGKIQALSYDEAIEWSGW